MKGFHPAQQLAAPSRTPAAQRAYTELRRKILYGELPAGTLLNEVDTASVLGVSRTPVREAFRELLNDGLIENGPRRQAIVTRSTPRLDREVSLMRAALEQVTVREAATDPEMSDLDQLRLIMIRARRALAIHDVHAIHDCDDEFHLQIARTARLPIVEDALRRLRGFTRLAGLAQPWTIDQLSQSAHQHELIIEAIESKDPESAATAMLHHLNSHLIEPARNPIGSGA